MGFKSVAFSKSVDTSSLQGLGKSLLDIAQWAYYEFNGVQAALTSTEADVIWNSAPPKPRRGTYAYADGTHWNPGAGEGPYFYNGTSWIPMAGGASVKRQIFTTPGTATYTPSPGMVSCIVECVGGGGGGGCVGLPGSTSFSLGGGGGGSGGYSRSYLTAAAVGASKTVTVGSFGAAGALSGSPSFNGSAGGDTSFGSLVIGKGGSGGFYASTGQIGMGGSPGVVGTGDVAAGGAPGSVGIYNNARPTAAVLTSGGNGGSSFFGGGGITNLGLAGGVALTGGAASNYGSGGAGGWSDAINAGANGGNGSAGICVVTEYCSQ